MRILALLIIFTALFSVRGFSQIKLPIEFRVEKQAMSTPMTDVEDVIFVRPYFTKPLNIKFDGSNINMYYDNGEFFTKKSVTKVNREVEYEDNAISLEKYYYTDKANVSDTILFVVDYNVGYVQMVLPTKNSKGINIGYTSFMEFVSEDKLALN